MKNLEFVQERVRGLKGDMKPHHTKKGWQNWGCQLKEEKISRDLEDCHIFEGQLFQSGMEIAPMGGITCQSSPYVFTG